MKKWIDTIISDSRRYTLPIMTHPGIEMIKCSVKEAVQDGVVHARAIQSLSQQYDAIASTVIMDLTLEAEAFGSKTEFLNDEMPRIHGHLVDAKSVYSLTVPSLFAGRIPEFLNACKLAAESITNKPVFAGAIGPFSLAGRLYGMSEIMVDCYLEPEAIHCLLEKCTQFILSYCSEVKKSTGCSGIIIAEPAAGLLSNEDCLQFSSVYIKQMVDILQDDNFLVILHNCGNSGQCTDAMLQTKAKAYHFGNAMSMIDALKQCPTDVLVMGNLDPVGVLKLMTPDRVYKETLSLLEQTRKYPNYILSTGCDVPPFVPTDNIQAYFSALTAFNNAQ